MHRDHSERRVGSGLAQRLKAVRKQVLGLSQDELAAELGLSQPAISMYEKGECSPNADALQKLQARFGIDVNWLLTGRGFWRLGEAAPPRARRKPALHPDDVALLEKLWQRLQGAPPWASSRPVVVTMQEDLAPLTRQPRGRDYRAVPYTSRMSAIGELPMEEEAKEGFFVVEAGPSTDCRSLRCLKITGDKFEPVFPAGSILGIDVTEQGRDWQRFAGKILLVAWTDSLDTERRTLARLAEVRPHAVFEPLRTGAEVPGYADVDLKRVRVVGRVVWAWHPVP